jgi:hypothetical protein
MATSRIIVKRKMRGRPPTGKALLYLGLRMSKMQVEAVEKWATEQADKPDRSEAIRRLIDRGLKRYVKWGNSKRSAHNWSDDCG